MTSFIDYKEDSDFCEYEDIDNIHQIHEELKKEGIEPIKMPDQISNFFQSNYDDVYIEKIGYFLALYDRREVSKRALEICTDVLSYYCLFYSAWSYRYFILSNMPYEFEKEIEYLEQIIDSDAKIYQSWYFYSWIIDRHSSKHNPFPFIKKVISSDSKNFHAWSFIISHSVKHETFIELFDLSNEMINLDVRNNSAWNGRKISAEFLKLDLEEEFSFVEASLVALNNNEASRNYIQYLCRKDASFIPRLRELGQALVKKSQSICTGYRLLLLVASQENDISLIREQCDSLIRIDPIRTNYYNLLKEGKIKYQ